MIKVDEFIHNNSMIEPQDVVVAGVSGGADSICLLFLLWEIQKKYDFTLAVAHVNHGIREDAGEDEEYVKSVCEKLKVPFFTKHADIPSIAKAKKLSEEEAGRIVRYEFFDEIGRLHYPLEYGKGKVKIAVAHHADDRAETFLLNLFRGTGMKGLASIQPVRGNVIRPLLGLTRAEIEQYLSSIDVAYKTDSTNLLNNYQRNKIRNKLLPYIKEEISPSVTERINTTADLMTEADRYIEGQVSQAQKRSVIKKTPVSIVIDCNVFSKEDPYIQSKLIHRILCELSGGGKDIGAVHIRSVMTLLSTSGSHAVDLPYRIKAAKVYDELTFMLEGKVVLKETQDIAFTKTKATELDIEGLGRLSFSILEKDQFNLEDIPRNKCTKWFDYDKINESLSLRKRAANDYLVINSTGNKKSLQDYMVDEKIPREDRDRIRVLADGSHILWVIGYRISSYYLVDENTTKILQVKLEDISDERNC